MQVPIYNVKDASMYLHVIYHAKRMILLTNELLKHYKAITKTLEMRYKDTKQRTFK